MIKKDLLRNKDKSANRRSKLLLFLALSSLTGVWFMLSYSVHYHFDWVNNFRPASLDLLYTGNPYKNYVYSPPWLYILIMPLALLPDHIGGAIISTITMWTFGFVAHKFGAKPMMIALLLFTPYVLFNALDGQVDFLIVLGFLMPPQIGLFLVAIKPQIGIGIALYWLVEAYQMGGVCKVIKTFAPVAVISLISMVFFGIWSIVPRFDAFLGKNYNWDASVFPFGLPIGLALLIHAIQKKDHFKAIAAGPLMAPYLGVYSWAVPLLGLIPNETIFTVVALCTWFVGWYSHKPDLFF